VPSAGPARRPGVTNFVMVKPRPVASDVNEEIARPLHRGVAFDAGLILVDIVDHQAALSGSGRSFVAKRDAERAARNAPGTTAVDNRLTVEPHTTAAALSAWRRLASPRMTAVRGSGRRPSPRRRR